MEDADLPAIDNDAVLAVGHLTVEGAVSAVVLELVGHVLSGEEGVVDGDDVDATRSFDGCTKHHAANAAESVDTERRHIDLRIGVRRVTRKKVGVY